MKLAWVYLIVAGVFEVGWPLGFKLSQTVRPKWPFVMAAFVLMVLSGVFLYLAQRDLPIGTAYAVWTGVGAAGTFLLGILIFGDPAGMLRLLSFVLIVAGIFGLKLTG